MTGHDLGVKKAISAIRRLRLQELITTRFGGVQARFAAAVDKQPDYVSRQLRGTKGIGEDFAREVETLLDLGDGWFDKPRSSVATGLQSSQFEAGPDARGRIPLVSWVQAGRWSEIIDNFQPGDAEEWLDCPMPSSDQSFVLRIKGLSMHDEGAARTFPPNHLIFVDPARSATPGDFVIAKLPGDNEATFKQLTVEGGRPYLVALNPSWPNRIIAMPEDAEIVGVVIFSGQRWV